MALFTFNIDAYINLPPSQVGDNNITIPNASTHTFTRANFTTETIPQYTDPEGDAANNLKILSLPLSGILKLNGVNIVINQIVSFSNIDSGLLIYESNSATTTAHSSNFNFEISDTGSNTFVG